MVKFKRMRQLAMGVLCLVGLSWGMVFSVRADSGIVNMNPHDIGAGTTMYYWSGGDVGFTVASGSRCGLEEEYNTDSAYVDGGYKKNGGSDVITSSGSKVTSFTFNNIMPSDGTYKLFVKNNSKYSLGVKSGFISYGL